MKTTQGTAAFLTMYRKKGGMYGFLRIQKLWYKSINQCLFIRWKIGFFSLLYPPSKWYLFKLTYSSSPSGQIIDYAFFFSVSMAHQSLSTLANIIPCSSRDYHNCSLGIETNCVVQQQQQQHQKKWKRPNSIKLFWNDSCSRKCRNNLYPNFLLAHSHFFAAESLIEIDARCWCQ